MNFKIFYRLRCLAVIALIFLFLACASNPVAVQLPISHAANHQAEESPFTPPPNIFQHDPSSAESQPGDDKSMIRGQQETTDKKKMNHKMDHGNMNQSGGKTSTHPAKKKAKPQHEEHKQ